MKRTPQQEKVTQVTVPFDVARLSANQRLHWGERSRIARVARTLSRGAWLSAGAPRSGGPVRVSLTVYRGRRLDADNALSGAKALLDGLFNDAITPTDSPEWVTLGEVRQVTGAMWRGRECVVVTVVEVEVEKRHEIRDAD